jgi:hypothetical protein
LSDGGSGSLLKFIYTHREETAKFTTPGPTQPFIVLYDSDTGAKEIKKFVASSNPTSAPGAPFVRVLKNLYMVPTPLLHGAQSSKIEDFFEPSIKATVIRGKTFDDNNAVDTDTHYGKKVFAEEVVKPRAATINFNGFRPLLTNLEAAIKAHLTASTTTP